MAIIHDHPNMFSLFTSHLGYTQFSHKNKIQFGSERKLSHQKCENEQSYLQKLRHKVRISTAGVGKRESESDSYDNRLEFLDFCRNDQSHNWFQKAEEVATLVTRQKPQSIKNQTK